MMHEPSAKLMLRLMASALGVSLEFLLAQFDSSYSASRAAMMNDRRTLDMWRAWLQDTVLHRLWNWRIAVAIRDGDLPPAPLDYRGVSEWYKVQWAPPELDWIDPLKQEQARQAAWRLGTGSITKFAREQGKDADEILGEKTGDIVTAHQKAQEAMAANPGLVLTWKDVIDAGVPGAQTTTEKGKTEPATEDDGGDA
jgi:capsid protein